MLSYPDVLTWADKALFKVVPKSASFTKAAISELIAHEMEVGKQTGDLRLFYNMNFPDSARSLVGFNDALKTLEQARILHRHNKPMSTYVPSIIKLLRKYYLDWQLSKGNQLSEAYISYVTAWFSQDKDYDSFIKEYRNLLNSMNDTDRNKVVLTTLHGLKGLEFKNMYIIDLADSIFPGTELTQVKDLSPAQKDILECEARRLFYVALTRSKENLELFFDADMPSRYIRFFSTNHGIAETYKDFIHEDNGFLVTDMNTEDSQFSEDDMDFSGFEDLADEDIDIEPLAAEVQTSPSTDLHRLSAPTSLFAELRKQEEEQASRLTDAVGAQNYNSIKGKSVITGILDRIYQEGKS